MGSTPPSLRAFMRALDEKFINGVQVGSGRGWGFVGVGPRAHPGVGTWELFAGRWGSQNTVAIQRQARGTYVQQGVLTPGRLRITIDFWVHTATHPLCVATRPPSTLPFA